MAGRCIPARARRATRKKKEWLMKYPRVMGKKGKQKRDGKIHDRTHCSITPSFRAGEAVCWFESVGTSTEFHWYEDLHSCDILLVQERVSVHCAIITTERRAPKRRALSLPFRNCVLSSQLPPQMAEYYQSALVSLPSLSPQQLSFQQSECSGK